MSSHPYLRTYRHLNRVFSIQPSIQSSTPYSMQSSALPRFAFPCIPLTLKPGLPHRYSIPYTPYSQQ